VMISSTALSGADASGIVVDEAAAALCHGLLLFTIQTVYA